MKPTRILFALLAAGLALPAAAEKCSVCNFDDEPIVVIGTKPAARSDARSGLGQKLQFQLNEANNAHNAGARPATAAGLAAGPARPGPQQVRALPAVVRPAR